MQISFTKVPSLVFGEARIKVGMTGVVVDAVLLGEKITVKVEQGMNKAYGKLTGEMARLPLGTLVTLTGKDGKPLT